MYLCKSKIQRLIKSDVQEKKLTPCLHALSIGGVKRKDKLEGDALCDHTLGLKTRGWLHCACSDIMVAMHACVQVTSRHLH